jgi:SPX domain protein involved in polyphosphate accumulation
LSARFNADVIDEPESFVHTDLNGHLDHWASLLNGIRLAMGQGTPSVTASPAILPMVLRENSSDVARRINAAMRSNSEVEFDSVFTYSPLGGDGARAIYWVHHEQLVELHVLLLQHTRSAFSRPSTSSGTQPSPSATRRSSVARQDSIIDRGLDHGVIVLDDAERFAQKQNSIPVSDTEEAYTRPQTQPAATVMWTANDDAIMCIADNFTKNTVDGFKASSRIRKKRLGPFLELDKSFRPQSSGSGSTTPSSIRATSSEDVTEGARDWLRKHKQVSPLVAILSRRTRLSSLPSRGDHGQWCTIDSDIVLKKASQDEFQGKDWPQRIVNERSNFPYAVLEVRQEGKNEVDLIKILDDSHLVSIKN